MQGTIVDKGFELDRIVFRRGVKVKGLLNIAFDGFVWVIGCQNRDPGAERDGQVNRRKNPILLFIIGDDKVIIILSVLMKWRKSIARVQPDVSVAILV
jgi:hypothetical protein